MDKNDSELMCWMLISIAISNWFILMLLLIRG